MAAIIDRSEGADFLVGIEFLRLLVKPRLFPILQHLLSNLRTPERTTPWDRWLVTWLVAEMSNRKKHGCLGYTGDITQLNGDYFINHYKDPY